MRDQKYLGDQLVAWGYYMTPYAQELINDGFRGNGCGSGSLSKIIALTSQILFGVNYHYACLIHDAEWSLLREQKSHLARIRADADFEINLINDSYAGGLTVTKLRLAAAFHAVVAINSPTAYWT